MNKNIKLAFVMQNFLVGGTTMALIDQLELLKEYTNVSLINLSGKYHKIMIEKVPKEIKIYNGIKFFKEKTSLKSKIKSIFIKSKKDYLDTKQFHKFSELDFYDVVHLFDIHFESDNFDIIKKNIKSNKFALWLQVDYTNYDVNTNEHNLNFLNKDDLIGINKIFSVSDKVFKAFIYRMNIERFNHSIIRLPINYNRILEKSTEFDAQLSDNYINIVSVLRISYEKGFDRIIQLAKVIKRKKLEICLNIIGSGYGDYYSNRIKTIREDNLEDIIKIHGYQKNPYPYIKKADLFLNPSLSESWGIVLEEAKILNKPIITTNVGAAKIILKDYEMKAIVKNDSKELIKTILELAYSKDFLTKKSSYHIKNNNKKEFHSKIFEI